MPRARFGVPVAPLPAYMETHRSVAPLPAYMETHPMQPANIITPVYDRSIADVFAANLQRATLKYPQADFLRLALTEELGELAQQMLMLHRNHPEASIENFSAELMDVAVVVARLCQQLAIPFDVSEQPDFAVHNVVATIAKTAAGGGVFQSIDAVHYALYYGVQLYDI